jgi:hypothetical protein
MLGFQLNGGDESSREITTLIDNAHLGHPIGKTKFEQLIQIHRAFRHIQADLVSSLQQGTISLEEYLSCFNSALREAMVQNERVLGHRDFVSVFGEAGHKTEGLVDPNTFFAETRNDPPKLRSR